MIVMIRAIVGNECSNRYILERFAYGQILCGAAIISWISSESKGTAIYWRKVRNLNRPTFI